MDDLPALPAQPAVPQPRRKYVRRKHPSRAEMAARRTNLEKARAAPKSVIYGPTAKREAASRANLKKAIAARKGPRGNAHARLNALKHGLNARLVRESVERLGEDPKEFAAHLRRMERFYVPEDDLEKQVVRTLAETVWKRLRLFTAQARLEKDRLARVLSFPTPPGKMSVEDTHQRAKALAYILNDYGQFLEAEQKLAAQVERGLRALLLKRSGGTVVFKYFAARHDPDFEGALKQAERVEILARWMALSPEERQNLGKK